LINKLLNEITEINLFKNSLYENKFYRNYFTFYHYGEVDSGSHIYGGVVL
jgi:hypothetical protein